MIASSLAAFSSGALVPLLAPNFYGAISTAPMTQLPLVLVPTYLVPTFLILHLTALLQARLSWQISNALPRRSHRHDRNSLGEAAPPLFRDQQIGQWAIRKSASHQISSDKRACGH